MSSTTIVFRFSMLALLLSQAACSINMSPRDPADGIVYAEPEVVEPDKERKVAADGAEPGMIRIERHTPGYTISMVLDATDENVHFVMDLPADEKVEIAEVAEKPEEQSAKNKPEFEDTQKDVMEAGKHVLYAQTYFFEQKYNRALSEVNRALEFAPDSAVAYSLKGSIHFKRGEQDKARDAWQKSLQLDPNQENVQQMLDKL